MDRRLCFCFGTCERHVQLLSSSFPVSTNSVLILCFCRAQCLVARALINTSVHSVIGAMQVCTPCEPMKPYTAGATRTGARFAAKDVKLLHICVVTWRSIPEWLSSNVSFAAANIAISVVTRDT